MADLPNPVYSIQNTTRHVSHVAIGARQKRTADKSVCASRTNIDFVLIVIAVIVTQQVGEPRKRTNNAFEHVYSLQRDPGLKGCIYCDRPYGSVRAH